MALFFVYYNYKSSIVKETNLKKNPSNLLILKELGGSSDATRKGHICQNQKMIALPT